MPRSHSPEGQGRAVKGFGPVWSWCGAGRDVGRGSPVRDGVSAKTAVPGSSALVKSVVACKIAVAGGVFAPGHLGRLITDRSPVPDQFVIIQHTRHKASGSHGAGGLHAATNPTNR